jgi:lysophospholipid acyltransferase (LPLAT)-like uncharacterized protein
MKYSIPLDLVSGSILTLTNVIGLTWTYTIDDPRQLDPVHHKTSKSIYCFWHTNLLGLFYYLRKAYPVALVSSSRDGQRLSAVLERWGYDLVRGSSSKGGPSAILECAKILENGRLLAITPDGPRGPAYAAKTGAARIALAAGASVVPVIMRTQRAWHTRSWDSFTIPKPFARIKISFVNSIGIDGIQHSPEGSIDMTRTIQKGLTA